MAQFVGPIEPFTIFVTWERPSRNSSSSGEHCGKSLAMVCRKIPAGTNYHFNILTVPDLTRFYEGTLACYYFAKSQYFHVYKFDTRI